MPRLGEQVVRLVVVAEQWGHMASFVGEKEEYKIF
jgi:hypothetical protein